MKEIGKQMIGGKTYEVSDWSPTKALRWEKRLFPRIGKAGGHFIAAAADEKMAGLSITQAVGTLFDDLSEQQFEEWNKELMEGVLCDGRPLSFDNDFGGGQMWRLNRVIGFVLGWQFRDFFAVGGDDLVGRLQKLVRAVRSTPVASSGKSGA